MSEKRKPNKKGKPPGGKGAPGGPMDIDLLEQIVELMSANDLNTVDVRNGDRRIILKRGAAAPGPVQYIQPAPALHAVPAGTPNASGQANTSAPAPPAAEDESKYLRITSPMVGTFYAAAKPGEKPLVGVGSTIVEDTEVCLIEAMKNFMPVPAGCRGTIAKVMVQDGEPVQFGTTLFLVTPS